MGNLPTDAKARKAIPIFSGFIDYFPDAVIAGAAVSHDGNLQHNPGEPLHWAVEKSTDHLDCLLRHALGVGTVDTDGHLHSAKAFWRAGAVCQLDIEASRHPDNAIIRDGEIKGYWIKGRWYKPDGEPAKITTAAERNGDWIAWEVGGHPPFGNRVEVVLRDGFTMSAPANDFNWGSLGKATIAKYRIVPKAHVTEPDNEWTSPGLTK